MTRRLLLAAAMTLGCVTGVASEPSAERAPKAASQPKVTSEQKAAPAQQSPLRIYLAKGEANACGEGCSEWIAVEGWFDRNAAERVSAFLKRHDARKPPVYFDSPGGSGAAAFAIGRQLRKLGFATGAAKTIPRGCTSADDSSKACSTAKHSPPAVVAQWRPDANCSSACVYALLGGKERHVPASARLGVHSAKLELTRRLPDGRVEQVTAQQAPSLHRTRADEINVLIRLYLREMGIDAALMEPIQKTPHEGVHYLSRDEIAAYGIDRSTYTETGWLSSQTAKGTTLLTKWIVELRGPDRKEYRTSIIALSCSQARRVTIVYLRGLASDEIGRSLAVTLWFGNEKVQLVSTGEGTKQAAADTGSLFSSIAGSMRLDSIETAAAQGVIRGLEADSNNDAKPRRNFELSTQGLLEGLKDLQGKCGAPPADWSNGASVPFAPTDAGSPGANTGLPYRVPLRPDRKRQ
jgi:hypothetical protein